MRLNGLQVLTPILDSVGSSGPGSLLSPRSANYFMDTSIYLRTKILDKVLYPSQYGKQDYSTPYIVNMGDRNQGLIYYGTEHSQNPNEKKFADIEARLKNFLYTYSLDKVNIAVESSIPTEFLDRDEMIKKYKESGFLFFLSKKYGVDLFCPEPGNKIIPLLLSFSEISSARISAWIFLNYLVSNFRFNKTFSIQDIKDSILIISNFVPSANYALISQCINYSTGKIMIPETPEEMVLGIQEVNFDSIEKLLSPFDGSTVFNIISSDFINVRDRFIAHGILSILEKGISVFTVFGTNHAIAQEPVFNLFFESKKDKSKP